MVRTYAGAGNLTGLRRYRSAATLVDQLTYVYPGASNRLSSVTDATALTSETWDAETGSFTYDANGNLLTAPGPYSLTATSYDAWNRRLAITRAGTTTSYRYAAGGQRLSKQVGAGAAEVYITDGPTTLGVFTVPASGVPSAWSFNLLADDRVVGRQPSTGSRLYYHRDLLNSTRAVVTGTTVVESRDYDSWGVELAGRTLGSGTKEGFTGQERDAESGVDAFWARAYLPALGRWGSGDPLRDSFPSWTPYQYVENDPWSSRDPFGLSKCPPECEEVFRQLAQLSPGLQRELAMFLPRNAIQAAAGFAVAGIVASNAVVRAGAGQVVGRQRLALDIAANRNAPSLLGLGRSVGRASHNARLRLDLARLPRGASDIRVNQQQVNALGERVGINRPNLQFTLNGRRYYVEYEGMANARGAAHEARILANDPSGVFRLAIIP